MGYLIAGDITVLISLGFHFQTSILDAANTAAELEIGRPILLLGYLMFEVKC
jgi:hypothetical protein